MSKKIIKFFIPQSPNYQKRHRMGRGFNYDPSRPDKNKTIPHLLEQMYRQRYTKLSGPLSVKIEAVYEIPKSYTKKQKQELSGAYKITKPDADNIAKFYLDVMSDLAYNDDNIVAKLSVSKRYCKDDEVPSVSINLRELQ